MKKALLIFFFIPVIAGAQPYGGGVDSATMTFFPGDSLSVSALYGATITIDTSTTALWQIGSTLKPVFSNDTTASRGIMTDTMNTYPANADGSFVLQETYGINFSINFWHTYQTDSLHAGCIVEYSTDTGATWINVADCENIVLTNFYSTSDTIISGQPAFTGNSRGEQLSSIYILNCLGEKSTSTTCMFLFGDDPIVPFYFRFRFVSDSTVDTLSGWKIDSIQIVNHICSGAVPLVTKQNTITLAPNPAYDQLTITATNTISQVTITNLLGQTVYNNKYNTQEAQIDIASLPKGIYVVKINDSDVRKFVKE